MAVVWKLERGNTRYEVRSAGRSVRLYTNGAFHSQHNPTRLLPGGVWDLIALPALCAPTSPRHALMLGVGGGASIQLLKALGAHAPARITGVEWDAVHLRVCRRFFGCNAPDIELIEADAIDWAHRSRRQFDLVIDDLFVHGAANADPERPALVDAAWLETLIRRTTTHGSLVQNHLSPGVARHIVRQHHELLAGAFECALVFDRPHYENGILVLLRERLRAMDARRRIIDSIADLDPRASRSLEFRCRRLF